MKRKTKMRKRHGGEAAVTPSPPTPPALTLLLEEKTAAT
jgi:hypothetical protein